MIASVFLIISGSLSATIPSLYERCFKSKYGLAKSLVSNSRQSTITTKNCFASFSTPTLSAIFSLASLILTTLINPEVNKKLRLSSSCLRLALNQLKHPVLVFFGQQQKGILQSFHVLSPLFSLRHFSICFVNYSAQQYHNELLALNCIALR